MIKNAYVSFFVTILFLLGCKKETTQTWELKNDQGDVAIVSVVPQSTNCTFSETAASKGWWIRVSGSNPHRIKVSGIVDVVRPYDHWTFNAFSGSGDGNTTSGKGDGFANGLYPNAYNVNGTIILNTSGLYIVSSSKTLLWSGTRK